MRIKGSKKILRPINEESPRIPPRMGRPPTGGWEAKEKRDAIEKQLVEERRIKKELRLAAQIEEARLKRQPGRPRKKPGDPPTPRRRPNGTYYPPEYSALKNKRDYIEPNLTPPIVRPPAVYSNPDPYEKYGL